MSKISAESFVETIKVNIDNKKLSDKEFREFIRVTMPIVYLQSEDASTDKNNKKFLF